MRIGRALLAAAGAAAAAAAAHNASAVRRLIAEAHAHDHALVHDSVVGDGDGPPLRLLILGDSFATGFGLADPTLAWPAQLARRLHAHTGRPVEVSCAAVRGHRIRHVIDEQLPTVADRHFDVVAISAGGNDVLGRRLPHQVRRDTRALLDHLQRTFPGAVVFLGGAGDVGAGTAIPAPLSWLLTGWSRMVEAAQREVAVARGVPYDAMRSIPAESIGPDGFHGGAPLHRAAADRTLAAIADRIPPGQPSSRASSQSPQ